MKISLKRTSACVIVLGLVLSFIMPTKVAAQEPWQPLTVAVCAAVVTFLARGALDTTNAAGKKFTGKVASELDGVTKVEFLSLQQLVQGWDCGSLKRSDQGLAV